MDRESKDSLDDPRIPSGLAARLKADRTKAQAEQAQLERQRANLFQMTDSVQGYTPTSDGRIDPNSVFTIREWRNPRGDTLYLRHTHTQRKPDLSQNEMMALAVRIQAEQVDFQGLNSSEQAGIRREGDPRFAAFLSNEGLKDLFRRLK